LKKPTHLDKDAHAKYDELSGIVGENLEDGDENLLAVLANSYVIYQRAYEALKDRGAVIAGETMVRENPAFRTVKETVRIIESLSKHFGLSPMSRGSKFIKAEKEGDEFDEF
jgi:P27 family predicted phage terminase small subunit